MLRQHCSTFYLENFQLWSFFTLNNINIMDLPRYKTIAKINEQTFETKLNSEVNPPVYQMDFLSRYDSIVSKFQIREAIQTEPCLLICTLNFLPSKFLQGENVKQMKKLHQADDGRDALAKALYSRLFGWIVSHINDNLGEDGSSWSVAYCIVIARREITSVICSHFIFRHHVSLNSYENHSNFKLLFI